MENVLSWIIVVMASISLILLVLIVHRTAKTADKSVEDIVREEIRITRRENQEGVAIFRREILQEHRNSTDALVRTVAGLGESQQQSLGAMEVRVRSLSEANERRFDNLRETVDNQLETLRKNNEKKLEEMRETVDEKLQNTLEKRLGESFKLVSERLEAVQQGLGDMKTLATGVGDLKRVLTNVKTRGTWGEYQLGDILEQVLTADQFKKNVKPIPESNNIVEYAVILPGKSDDTGPIYLPVDSKFPHEDYQRLTDAAESADLAEVEKYTAALIRAIKESAKDITQKYIQPPHTTDFGIMFLPTEGLYAEVLRQPGLVEQLQHDYRVVVAGPTTLTAILNSLRMGFRTLAIEKRSSEVWTILSAVKTEFGKFGTVLDAVKRQLATASKTIENTGVRTRAMERKLREVEELPSNESSELLGIVEQDDNQDILNEEETMVKQSDVL